MKPQFSHLAFGLAGAVFLAPYLSAQVPSMPEPPRAKAGDVREEQRHIADYLTYAGSDLQKGLERAGDNSLDLATVSGLHAVGELLQCSKLMDHDPDHIEEVRPWFFDNDAARSEMRNNFFLVLKPHYDDLEDRLDSFARSLRDRGYSAVYVTINQLRAWNTSSDPAAKQQIEQEIDRVVDEVSRDAASKPGGASDASTGIQASAFPGSMGAGASAGGGSDGAYGGASGTQAVPLGGGVSAMSSPAGVVITDGSGRSATLPGAILNPDGTARLPDGRTVDLRGATIDPNGAVRLPSGEDLGGGGSGSAGIPDANSRFVAPDGSEVVIPADFNWRNGVATGIEKVYVGGRGGRLIRETKVTFRPTPSGQPNTYVVNRENGESRSWALDVAQVPGSEKKSTGSLSVAFELSDRDGASAFTTENWSISGPSGAAPIENVSGNQATATFTVSGDYQLEVSGKTDWGSDFVIRKTLPVGVE